MSERYSRKKKNDMGRLKAMFSVVCLCIIALATVIFFSGNNLKNNSVNENTTLKATTEVNRAVTLEETTEETTAKKAAVKRKKSPPTSMKADGENTPYKSDYTYPISEAVLKGYSEELVFDKTMGDYRAHAAVDFKGAKGDAVRAVNKGVVTDVYDDNLLGGVIEIDHGGKLTAKYCGVENVCVNKGDSVKKGEKIATLSTVPCESADAYHLHFETRIGAKPVNPLDVMSKSE
ncbi:MAG: M23 family metallopeptidase [Eubacterium sp.]|nr:M23 family metallopeptidase [Eubacterium sp.]